MSSTPAVLDATGKTTRHEPCVSTNAARPPRKGTRYAYRTTGIRARSVGRDAGRGALLLLDLHRRGARRAAEHAVGLLARQPREHRLAALGRFLDLALAGEPVLRDRLGLDPRDDVAVARHARSGGDELADDHVLLQTEQGVR